MLEIAEHGDVRLPSNAPSALLKPLKVLHLEDSEDDCELVMRELRHGGFNPACHRVDSRAAFKAALHVNGWDIIISDYALPSYNGLQALADTREAGRDIPFILVSGTLSEAGAVDVMRAGAQDYVLKESLGRLPLAVEREVREAGVRAAQRTMAEQLVISERMASAGMLAAGVAHEINNPLTVVIANLDFVRDLLGELAAREPLLERYQEGLSEIEFPLRDAGEAVARIRAIVRDVSLFSRSQDVERGPIDVRVVIESSIRMAWNEIRHRAQLKKEYGIVPLVDSNEARLGQILLNLLVNAAQAMPDGSASQNEIRVVTKMATEGFVVIEVHDTGSGIPKNIVDRIFNPFFTTKRVGVGTGLGLSLCYRMVSDLGGTIAVESEVGKGTIVRVRLPIATGHRRHISEPKVLEEVLPARARVLVIDDEVAIGRVLQRGLGQLHDVVVLSSGREAITRIAGGERFDAILSDLMMPEVTGIEIHEALSTFAPDQAQRMIFLTGGAFTERAREFLDRIPNARVEKPFDVATILRIISGAAETT